MSIMKSYFIALLVFFVMDMLWLGIFAKNFYSQQIGFLMKTNINWFAAIIFYLIFIFGLVYFVINPALEKGSIQTALLTGAFFGLITYSTYDLTNLAVLKDWPIYITLVDIVWGIFLSAIVSGSTYYLSNKL